MVAPPSRRALLKIGGAAGVLLALGGGALAWLGAGYDGLLGPDDVAIAMSKKELAVVRALCDALLPASGEFPSGLAVGVPQRIDEELWAMPARLREQLRDGIQLLEHVPPLYGKAHRFTALGAADRLLVFESMLKSSRPTLRQIAIALKQLCHLYYYAHPAVWPAIRYDGPFIQTPRPPDSHVAYAQLLARRPS